MYYVCLYQPNLSMQWEERNLNILLRLEWLKENDAVEISKKNKFDGLCWVYGEWQMHWKRLKWMESHDCLHLNEERLSGWLLNTSNKWNMIILWLDLVVDFCYCYLQVVCKRSEHGWHSKTVEEWIVVSVTWWVVDPGERTKRWDRKFSIVDWLNTFYTPSPPWEVISGLR